MKRVIHNNLVIPNYLQLECEKSFNCNLLREFDECLTRRVMGYSSADEYYKNISCHNNLDRVNIPLLCINAQNDEIAIEKVIPYNIDKINNNIVLLVTKYGGHLSWIDNSSLFRFNQWHTNVVFEFLNNI